MGTFTMSSRHGGSLVLAILLSLTLLIPLIAGAQEAATSSSETISSNSQSTTTASVADGTSDSTGDATTTTAEGSESASTQLNGEALAALPSGLVVTPSIINEKVKARDILPKTVQIVNNTDARLDVYPSVVDVDQTTGEVSTVSSDDGDKRASSLSNWIEISRGVIELEPGEQISIPLTVRVNMNAVPGTYNAKLTFGTASTREEATVVAEVAINVEVLPDGKEDMQLLKFFTENFYLSGDDVLFQFQLENVGNQETKPHGEIRIFNRHGEEVATIDANKDGKAFTPDQMGQLAATWAAAEGFGKYKALLTLDYGNSQKASLQDTIYFWVLPWKQLLAFFAMTLVGMIGLAVYSHRWFERRHHMALAGIPAVASNAEVVEQMPTEKKPRRRFAWLRRKSKASAPTTTVSASVAAQFAPTTEENKTPAEWLSTLHQTKRELNQNDSTEAPNRSGGEHEVDYGKIAFSRTPINQTGSAKLTDAEPRPEPASISHGHTIDLKNRSSRAAAPKENGESHVVNLRKR